MRVCEVIFTFCTQDSDDATSHEDSSLSAVMIGDDVGNVPALAAAVGLGAVGLRVAGAHFGRTDVDLQGPQGVLTWLSALADPLKV